MAHEIDYEIKGAELHVDTGCLAPMTRSISSPPRLLTAMGKAVIWDYGFSLQNAPSGKRGVLIGGPSW